MNHSFILSVKPTVVPRLLENYWNVKYYCELWIVECLKFMHAKKKKQNSSKPKRSKSWRQSIESWACLIVGFLSIHVQWFTWKLTSGVHDTICNAQTCHAVSVIFQSVACSWEDCESTSYILLGNPFNCSMKENAFKWDQETKRHYICIATGFYWVNKRYQW